MSGGSLNYLFSNINDAIPEIKSRAGNITEYIMFADYLQKVSNTLYKIEWALSGDIDDEEAVKSIKEFFGGDEKIDEMKTKHLAQNIKKDLLELADLISGKK